MHAGTSGAPHTKVNPNLVSQEFRVREYVQRDGRLSTCSQRHRDGASNHVHAYVSSHRSYKRVNGRSHTVEKRLSMHPHKPHATSQPSRFSHTHRPSTHLPHNQHSQVLALCLPQPSRRYPGSARVQGPRVLTGRPPVWQSETRHRPGICAHACAPVDPSSSARIRRL